MVVWLVVGVGLFSAMRNLQPRYLETLAPAPAGLIGIGAAVLLARVRRRPAAALLGLALIANAAFAVYVLEHSSKVATVLCLGATGAALVLLLAGQLRAEAVGLLSRAPTALLGGLVAVSLFAAPAQASIDLVSHNSTDAPTTGTGGQLSPYLRAHHDRARYEVATSNFYDIAGLIMRDARPVIVLNDVHGILVHLAKLQRLVRDGAVRYIVLSHPCRGGRHCPSTTRWSLDHSKLVHRPNLYLFNAGA
jgi:4-amino-4-deoxy-L-arabinose transferase-like glycosyltransferase